MAYLGFNGTLRQIPTDDEEIDATFEEFGMLFLSYQDPSVPFIARIRPKWLSDTFKGDYDQLARLGEWADGDAFKVVEL